MVPRLIRTATTVMMLAPALALGVGNGVSHAATLSPPAAPSVQVSTPGGVGIRLLQVPASEANDPRAQEYIIDHLNPGTVVHREFEVSNLGDAPAHVTVYAAAASIANGVFQFAAGQTQNEMTTWVSISQPSVTVAAHGNVTLTATIAVPSNAPPGSQYGVIWAQETGQGKGRITMVSRAGIRIYLSVGPGGAAAPNFTLGTPVTGRTSSGAPYVKVPVSNTGGVAVDVHGTVALANGPGGVQAGPFQADSVDTLAPGQTAPDTFVLSKSLPNGPWHATFTLVSGLITKTETATINFTGAPAIVTHPTTFPVIPVVAGSAGAVVLLAIVIVVIARRRRHGGHNPQSPKVLTH